MRAALAANRPVPNGPNRAGEARNRVPGRPGTVSECKGGLTAAACVYAQLR